MKKITRSLLERVFLAFIFTFVLAFNSYAQNDPFAIRVQNDYVSLSENIDTFQWSQLGTDSEINNGYYVWIQFYETPIQDIQDAFKSKGIDLIDFIGSRAYLANVPSNITPEYLKSQGVRAIAQVQGKYKLSENLRLGVIGDWAVRGNNIRVTLLYHDNFNSDYVIQDLATKQISVEQEYKGHTAIDLLIPNNCLEELSSLPYVKYIEVIVAPAVKEDTPARVLHRAAGLDTQTDAGRNYTGAGIGVMVRDDGIVGPHIDFQGRIDNSQTSGTGQTHGDGVAGILAGAGNLNPNNRGMAAGSNIFVVNYVPNFLDSATTGLINDGSVQITNSSYGDGCNGGYTLGARTVDSQINDIPSLLHVFSCGNSNNVDCGYGAGNQWGNITGGHKQGKNVIATANVFFDGSLVGSSSHGPATDGRIKPDITANGQNQISTNENNAYLSFGGTSGASPGIAGISAQLYELYGEFNNGELPQSALIKATLLNTANDAGNVGPDFRFGWGIVNGLRAGKLLEDGRFLMDTATQGSTNTHTINVPAGTTQVRFMAYWADPAAASGATTALVNDLDLVVEDPSSTNLLPWILDSTPNPTALNQPATNGEDHLNNMEQVLINNPQAGDYTISVSGFDVPVGPQEYFVVYEIIQDQLTVTHPNDGERMVPGSNEVIHWDAINTTDDFIVEYSADGGSNYTNIATVNAGVDFFIWNVPSEITGQGKVRVTSGNASDNSDGIFSIANQVTGLTLDQACPDDTTYTWNPVDGATSYDLYILGDQEMEIAGTSSINSITVPTTNIDDPIWYAITASNEAEGWTSERTIASFYEGGILNCVLNNDLRIAQILSGAANFSGACGAADGIVSATIENNGMMDQTDFLISYQLSGQSTVEETFSGILAPGESIDYEFTTTLDIPDNGDYSLEVNVSAEGDEFADNDALNIEFFVQVSAETIPFEEDFETNGFPGIGWSIINVDNDDTWEEINVLGIEGVNTTTGFVNNFTYDAGGSEDMIQTLIFDLDLDDPVLIFDLAKAQFSTAFSDGLRIDISVDCGVSFTSIYEKDGLELSTIEGFQTTVWTPASGDDWRTEIIDLISYQGQTAMFRIVNIGGFGNSTFVDNINVGEEEALALEDTELTNISVFPNPASDQVNIVLPNTISGITTFNITNNLGQVVLKSGNEFTSSQVSLDISNLSQGIYFITIENNNQRTIEKLIVR